jgi:hypothetical protein
MRAPPAVSAESCDGPWWRVVLWGVPALAFGALAGWAAVHLGVPLQGWEPALMAAVLAAVVGVRTRSAPRRLEWSGAGWSIRPTGGTSVDAATPQVMIDLGPWMLLQTAPVGGRPLWLAFSRASSGPAWQPLRAAVYSSVPDLVSRSAEERPPF